MPEIRKLPAQEDHVETGPLQFGDDWPGVFIRGDNAFYYMMCIDQLLKQVDEASGTKPTDVFAKMAVKGLRDLLLDSNINPSFGGPNAVTNTIQK